MMRKFLNIIFNIIIYSVILVSLMYIISSTQTQLDSSHIPSVMGFTPLTVISGSMSPEIETGDMVIIRRGNKNIRPGDVITYKMGDVLVTHRVKNISGMEAAEVFTTQGDANRIPDYISVERSQILGKYVFRIPMGGYIKASLRGLPGILILVGLSLIVIMTEVLNRTQEKVNKIPQTIIHN